MKDRSPFPGRRRLRMADRFLNLGLATKLTVIVYAGFITIFVFLTILMVVSSRRSSLEEKKRQAAEFLNSGMSMLREEMQYISGIAEYIGLAEDIQALMESGGRPSATLSSVSRQRFAVSAVIYNRAGRVLDFFAIDGSSGPLDQPADDARHPLYRVTRGGKAMEWQYIPAGNPAFMARDNSPKLCLWQQVQSIRTRDVVGAMAICVDVRKFLNVGPRLGAAYRSLIVVNDRNEEVFNNTGIPLNPGSIAAVNALSQNTPQRLTIGKTSYWAFTARVANTYLRLLYLVPNTLPWDIGGFYAYTIAAVALFMILLVPLFYYLTKSVTRPLKKLTASMDSFARGDAASQMGFRYQDEVGRLGQVFDSMLSENKRLVSHNYMLQLKEKEATLSALQAQINPHFLYNAVNSIQWLALKSNCREVADLVYTLGRMFRAILGARNRMATVEQETELVRSYLKLQKQCFGNRFDYLISVGEGAGALTIPRLCLQPLVENAIVHGVERSERKVHIAVRVFLSKDGSLLRLEVEDDGPGIAPERLALLPDRLSPTGPEEEAPGSRMAMKNISERLKITYGDRYEFSAESIPGVRTRITLTLPAGGEGQGPCTEKASVCTKSF